MSTSRAIPPVNPIEIQASPRVLSLFGGERASDDSLDASPVIDMLPRRSVGLVDYYV